MRRLMLAKRTERQQLQPVSQNRAPDHGAGQCRENIHSRFRYQKQADISAYHENSAMRHINDIQYPENQCISDSNNRISASQRQTIDKLLKKHDNFPPS